MLKICAIAPVVESADIRLQDYRASLYAQFGSLPDVTVVGSLIDEGPAAVESAEDAARAIPGVLRAGYQARADGAQGVLIDCMLDPGLEALRCALDIPVVGAADTGFRLAAMLGHRFGVIDVCDDTGALVRGQLAAMGLDASFAGVRGTGLGVLQVAAHPELALRKLIDAAVRSVVDDGAEVLVLGCTEFSRHAATLRAALQRGGLDVPVLNPTAVAAGTLVTLIRAGLCHSKRAYPGPGPSQ